MGWDNGPLFVHRQAHPFCRCHGLLHGSWQFFLHFGNVDVSITMFTRCLPDVYQLHPVTRTRRFLHRYGFHPPFDRFLGETIGFPFGTPQFFFALKIEDLCRRFRPTAATRRPFSMLPSRGFCAGKWMKNG
jgi:hypothetical protein